MVFFGATILHQNTKPRNADNGDGSDRGFRAELLAEPAGPSLPRLFFSASSATANLETDHAWEGRDTQLACDAYADSSRTATAGGGVQAGSTLRIVNPGEDELCRR